VKKKYKPGDRVWVAATVDAALRVGPFDALSNIAPYAVSIVDRDEGRFLHLFVNDDILRPRKGGKKR